MDTRFNFKNQNKEILAFLPTPLHTLPRLTKLLKGPTIFIKRDDQTGLACGGNKTRKLEYLFADALLQDIDTIVTAGALQSNHCRQTAAAAAQLGLRCELLLNSHKPKIIDGNTLLDILFGAKIHWQLEDKQPKTLPELAQRVKDSGYKPYIIPYGGSNALGVCGYINAMVELQNQLKESNAEISHIFLASCSGATQVGMVIGAKLTGFTGKIIGISVDYNKSQADQYMQEHLKLAQETIQLLNLDITCTKKDFLINYDFINDGYGVVSSLEKDAINSMAQSEGILLDPVYTGRAFGGMLNMITKKELTKNDTVLFWHTGGTPAIFPYGQELIV